MSRLARPIICGLQNLVMMSLQAAAAIAVVAAVRTASSLPVIELRLSLSSVMQMLTRHSCVGGGGCGELHNDWHCRDIWPMPLSRHCFLWCTVTFSS